MKLQILKRISVAALMLTFVFAVASPSTFAWQTHRNKAATVAGGGVAGAVIGGLLGGGKGALIGGLIGAGAGTAIAESRNRRDNDYYRRDNDYYRRDNDFYRRDNDDYRYRQAGRYDNFN